LNSDYSDRLLGDLLKAPFQSWRSGRTIAAGAAPERAEDLALLRELCESGEFKPVIDGSYPLVRIAEAYARADSGRKVGNVVITMDAS
jgi:NADPH:quinone reductase-like Zn-dependent oxidoreductase